MEVGSVISVQMGIIILRKDACLVCVTSKEQKLEQLVIRKQVMDRSGGTSHTHQPFVKDFVKFM